MRNHFATIQLRRDFASSWTFANLILAQGEPGFELDTGKFKIGDGITTWNALPYAGGGAIDCGGAGAATVGFFNCGGAS